MADIPHYSWSYSSLPTDIFDYNEETGELIWKKNLRQYNDTGKPAGTLNHGYLRVTVYGKTYAVHRLIWFIKTGDWPISQIDHINGIRNDNRWCNLRDVDQSTNMENRTNAMKTSSSGILGVYKYSGNRFRAQIKIKGVIKHLGICDTVEAASTLYLKAKREFHKGYVE